MGVPGGCNGWPVTTLTRAHPGCPPRGPRHQTNLSYEPGKKMRGWGLVMVLTVLVVRMVLMVMVLVKVMAASDGEPSVPRPSVPPSAGQPDWGATVRPNIC